MIFSIFVIELGIKNFYLRSVASFIYCVYRFTIDVSNNLRGLVIMSFLLGFYVNL